MKIFFALLLLAVAASAQTPFAVDDFRTGRSRTIYRQPVLRSHAESVTPAATSSAQCTTTGPQNIAVLTVTTPANPALPAAWNNAALQQAYFAQSGLSLNTFWQDASYGLTSATGQVFGPFALSANYDCSNLELDGLASAAISAASSSVDFTRYTRIGIIFPVQSCVLPGFGSIGGYGSIGCYNLPPIPQNVAVAWLPIPANWGTPANSVGILAHEHGHNLGLHHGNTEDFGTLPLGAPDTTGTNAEYGDPFSVMGNADIDSTRPTFGQYSSEHKSLLLNWLLQPGYLEVQTAGTFTLAPYESASGTRALRILRDPVAGSWLWLEYRQPVGTVDTTLSNLSGAKTSNVFNGALVHYENPNLDSLHTYLLDFHAAASPNNFYTAALTPGQTWSDPYSLLTLKANSANSSGLSVTATWDTACATLAISNSAVTVTAPSSCAWTASTGSAWITLNGPPSGTGSATIPYTLAANTTANQRLGFITVQRQSLAILQPGTSISITGLTPAVTTAASGIIAIQVTDPAGVNDIVATYITFSGSPSCAVTVYPPSKQFALTNDAGTALLGPTASGTLTNSVCSVLAADSSITGQGTQLTINLAMTFPASFGGSHHITAMGQTQAGTIASLTMGTWTVPAANAPALSSIAPTQTTAGTPAFTITATGSNFTAAESIQWNGTALATTFVGATQLTVTVPANLIAIPGPATLTVSGATGSATFTINPAPPVLSAISPNTAVAGSAAMILTLTGANFLTATAAQWNGVNLATGFVSATQLTATVQATLLTSAGTANITVTGGSGSQSFTITPAPPVLTAMSPNTVVSGNSAFTLTLTGSNFVAITTAQWNGNNLTTTFVNSAQLTATVPASLVANAGTAVVTVTGGSGSQTFTVTPPPPLITAGGIVPIGNTVSTVAPGSWISIYGTNLATGIFNWDGTYRTTLGGVSVLINGKPAYLSYVSPTQINVLTPDDTAQGTVPVVVTTPTGKVSSTVTLATIIPTLLPLNTRYAIAVIPAVDGSYTIASAANPVKPGQTVELFGEGFGPTSPPVLAAKPFSGAPPTANPVTVTVGGVTAQVNYAGMILNGLYQINVVIPPSPAGDQLIRASVAGAITATGIYLPISP